MARSSRRIRKGGPNKPHGTYKVYLCERCGWGIGASQWQVHRRICDKIRWCKSCGDPYPCSKKRCPDHEGTRIEIPRATPGKAPRFRMCLSLRMKVDRHGEGWKVMASWLKEPVYGDTWEQAYDRAMRAKGAEP